FGRRLGLALAIVFAFARFARMGAGRLGFRARALLSGRGVLARRGLRFGFRTAFTDDTTHQILDHSMSCCPKNALVYHLCRSPACGARRVAGAYYTRLRG